MSPYPNEGVDEAIDTSKSVASILGRIETKSTGVTGNTKTALDVTDKDDYGDEDFEGEGEPRQSRAR